jgi:hypothetical protein
LRYRIREANYEKYTVGRNSIGGATGRNGDSYYRSDLPKTRLKSEEIVAIVQGAREPETWASVRQVAPLQEPSSAAVPVLLLAL